MHVFPPDESPVYLIAIAEALEAYLVEKTQIDWQYYKSSIVPSLGAKGGIKVSKVPPGDTSINLDTHIKNYLYFQGRIIVASSESEKHCQSILLAWQQFLENIFKALSIQGLNGTWDSVLIRNGLMGIQPSDRGYQLAIEETSVDQDTDEGIWTGLLFFEHFAEYERYVESSF